MENATVDMLKDQSDSSWDEETIRSIFDSRDAELIMQIPLANQQTNDRIIWPLEENGRFSVKSCYRALSKDFREEDKVYWSSIWRLKIPPKVKVFFWQVCSECIPTKDLLVKRKVRCDNLCDLCNEEQESIWHLFVDCSYVKQIWNLIGFYSQTPTP